MRHVLLLVLLLVTAVAPPAKAASVEDSRLEVTDFITSGLAQITGLGWAPDGTGRLFVTEKTGTVRLVVDGVLQTAPFATESVHTNGECGLLGLAFDPDYRANRYVYFFVTVSPSEQAIVRYTDGGSQGTNRTVIVARLPTAGQNHVGGGLGFGPDGRLYWSIGDLGNGTGVDADLTSLASKVGRANPDGTPVADNPFNDGVGPNNEFIWARGFRNPYTMTFHPRTGELWLNVVGTGYEQSFVVSKGSHGGYNDFEANQPQGYLAPRIAYRTNGSDLRSLSPTDGAVRQDGVATFTTTAAHHFQPGQRLSLTAVADASFDGTAYVLAVPDAQSFTVAQAGPDASSGGGSARTDALGGCITGGAFYDSTLLPEEYRESFLFGDFNSGNLIRAQFSEETVSRVDVMGGGFSSNTDLAVGPDGAIYTSGIGGGIRRVAPIVPGDVIVLSSRHVRVVEGSEAQVAVRLSRAPAANVTIQVSGTSSRFTMETDDLTFTPTDWNRPRFLRIRATADSVEAIEETDFLLQAAGYADQSLRAFTMERRAQVLTADPSSVTVPRGGSQAVTVRLWKAPTASVEVTARLEGNASLLTIASATSLTLTRTNWSAGEAVVLQASSSGTELEPQEDVLILEAAGLPPLRVPVSIPGQPSDPADGGESSDAGVDGGAEPDAGQTADAGSTTDGGLTDGGLTDGSEDPEAGGCGCSGSGAGLPFVLGGLLWLARRRRH